MRVQWQIEAGTRCDIVTYAAQNLTGRRGQVRIFPSGSRRGEVHGENLRSMVIRAPFGTRIVLVSVTGPEWEEGPWRCVRLLESEAMPSEKGGGLPGVRIPDLDLLDDFDAKRTNTDIESTYPNVPSFAEGTGWTFGRTGSLKGRVAEIRIERDTGRSEARLLTVERLARAVLGEIATRAPGQLSALCDATATHLEQELERDGVGDAAARAASLRAFGASLS